MYGIGPKHRRSHGRRPQSLDHQLDAGDNENVTPVVSLLDYRSSRGDDYDVMPAVSTLDYHSAPVKNNVWRNPDWLIDLNSEEQRLLHHFATRTVACIVLHQQLHSDFCSTIIPMALHVAHCNILLAAILCTAAAHRKSLGLVCDDSAVAYQKQRSLQGLGRQLSHQIEKPTSDGDVYIAASLTLALCEMLEGGEKPNSWRAHLKGAAALLGVGQKTQTANSDMTNSPSRVLLRRWWQTYEGQTVFNDRPVPLTGEEHNALSTQSSCDEYIDDFHGFSTGLLPIIDELNLLIVEKQALKQMEDAGLDCDQFRQMMELRTNKLILSVKRMIENRTPKVHETFNIANEAFELSEFFKLDEAYHYITLIKIYQRILGLQSTDVAVQQAVERAIDCISRITLHDFACPGVALLQPLFTVGCEAHRIQDREFVVTWLDKLRRLSGMGNADRSKEILLELWEKRDSMSSKGAYLHWNELHGKISSESRSNRTLKVFRDQRMGARTVLIDGSCPIT